MYNLTSQDARDTAWESTGFIDIDISDLENYRKIPVFMPEKRYFPERGVNNERRGV